jgi:hypothetical protein
MPKPVTPAINRNKPRQAPPQPTPGESASAEAIANRSAKEFRHRNLRATIWRNDTDKGPIYNVTLSRRYRDDEHWKDSHSFGYDDLKGRQAPGRFAYVHFHFVGK